jgi:hypothetical protein
MDCPHFDPAPTILSDRSVVYDCTRCGSALVDLGGSLVRVIEGAAA